MRLPLFLLSGLLALAACADDDDPTVDGGGQCECELPTAAEVTYDNTASALPGATVQDAIDDVATRTDPAGDAVMRISYAEDAVSTLAALVASKGVACPAGHKALGGSCDGFTTDGSLLRSVLLEDGYQCYWNNPTMEVGVELKVTVSCLGPPTQ